MERSMFKSLLLPDLRMMLEEDDGPGLEEFCKALYPAVAAEVLEELEAPVTWSVLTHCDPSTQAAILQFLPLTYQIALVESIDQESLARIIEEMPADDRVDLLERMAPARVEDLLPLVSQTVRNDIRKLLSYADNTAGSIMTTEFASLPEDITVAEAFERLRKQATTRETIYYIYITDNDRHLLGFISIRKLIQSPRDVRIGDIMQRDVISVRLHDDQEHVAREITKYDFLAIPVVDNQNRLVGIVTHDDAADVLEEEATEDQQRLAAVEPLEDSYLESDLKTLAWKRGIWLVFLQGAAFLTAYFISFFLHEESGSGWMMMFLPLVLASGGNTGSQSATLIIRTLALGESSVKDARRIGLRELLLGSLLGAGLSLLSFTVACTLVTVPQAAVVAATVFIVVLLGSVCGALLPLCFRGLGVDPALMSNPLIAALVDVLGVIIYYNMAGLIAHA